jgi:sulfate transport system permease protein
MRIPLLRQHSVLPGFGLAMGWTLFCLAVVVLIPLSGLFFKTATMTGDAFWQTISSPRVMNAYKISFGIAFAAALINAFFGLIVAWILVRYTFPFKRIVDAAVDLPFALPTAVAGIALATLYAPQGWLGKPLAELGIKVAFTPLGILLALVFVGLPFVVRTVQPILEDLEKDVEEVAASLGASRRQIFCRVLLPQIFPALLTGVAMSFARALGEYGSVIFIAGNLPNVSEIIPLLITIKLEQYDYTGATALAVVMLLASFVLLLLINILQKWSSRQ